MSYSTVKCLVCGTEYKQLTQHLRNKHAMTVDMYRNEYGQDAPVWSQECLDRPSPMKGKKHTEDTRAKIIQNLINTKGIRKGKNIGVSGLPVYTHGDGYLGVWVDGKNVYEHRYIMEQHLGRKLKEYEVVHHRDENKHNNNLDNLILTTKKKHDAHHMSQKRRNGTIPNDMLKGRCNNPNGRRGKR